MNTANLKQANTLNQADVNKALAQLQSWISSNPAPATQWGAIKPPTQTTGGTIGGGSFGGPSGGTLTPPASPSVGTPSAVPGAPAPGGGKVVLPGPVTRQSPNLSGLLHT